MRAWIVDAFADGRFRGNAAAVVCLDGGFPSTERMQCVARELDVPTTAFVVPQGPPAYRVRWFTPGAELQLCGHATMASACYLYDVAGVSGAAELSFQTHSGPLYARREGRAIWVNLPRMDAAPCTAPPGLEAALGARIVACARAVDDILVELESAAAVAALRPDFGSLAAIACRGHVVTAAADDGETDFVSRSFFPALGVDEDQVCVSAHCKLAPFWGERLGKRRLDALQLSPRGGRLRVEVVGDRVHVAGSAVVRRSVEV